MKPFFRRIAAPAARWTSERAIDLDKPASGRTTCIAALVALTAGGMTTGARSAPTSVKDIEFAHPAGVSLKMDVSTPDGPGPFPAVIFVLGGGFTAGTRQGFNKSLAEDVQKIGIAWIPVDYRLAPQFRFPAHTDDVATAVAFVKKHAKEWRIDPERLVLWGESAGGHLVSYVGARGKGETKVAGVISFFAALDLERRSAPKSGCYQDGHFIKNPKPGHPQFCMSEGMRKFLGVDGPGSETTRIVKAASPIRYIHEDMPPYLLIHGTNDRNSPFEQSVFMFEAMNRIGAKADLYVVEGGGHGSGEWDQKPETAGYRPYLLAWLKRTLKL
jgi:alpha-L-fucosidase 2